MSGFLLDTNVISELTRPKPEPRVTQWLDSIDESQLYLSVLTLGEIRKGLRTMSPGQRRTRLEMWLTPTLKPDLPVVCSTSMRRLPITGATCGDARGKAWPCR